MSNLIKPVLVVDSRLNIKPTIDFAVYQGGQNVSQQQFSATTFNSSSHNYVIQVPSTTVVTDRRVLWQSTVEFTITGIPIAGSYLVNYGTTDSFAPFPLHQLCNTINAQINNTSVSVNMQDCLPGILRCMDKESLSKYSNTTPVYLDTYRDASPDQIGYVNNPNGNYTNIASNSSYYPRGAFAVNFIKGNTIQATGGTDTKTVVINATFTEPLMLSPFVYGDSDNEAGFFGITQLQLVMNIDSSMKRMWRSCAAPLAVPAVLSKLSFENSALLVNFLTPKPSNLISEVSVLPILEIDRYISQNNADVAAYDVTKVDANGQVLVPTVTLNSTNFQLGRIPDSIVIFVRDNMGTQNMNSPDSFLSIRSITINWNNANGLLSNASQQQLYEYSVESGVNMSWVEWSGLANVGLPAPLSQVGTTGSVLMLKMAQHIPLSEQYYSPSSLGAFNLQFNVTCANYSTAAKSKPELVLLCVNSGVFSTINGQSMVNYGVLSKQSVMDVVNTTPISHVSIERLIGGKKGLFSNVKSNMANHKFLKHLFNKNKGGASSGGAISGGAISGGNDMSELMGSAISGGRRKANAMTRYIK